MSMSDGMCLHFSASDMLRSAAQRVAMCDRVDACDRDTCPGSALRVRQRGEVTSDTTRRLFAEHVLPYLDDVHTLARWLTGNATDAEDVAQEVCLRALRALEKGPADNPRPWLLAVTRNTAFTWLARNRPKSIVLTPDPEADGAVAETGPAQAPDAALIAAADAADLEAAMAELPALFRETLVMREINGLSYRDIAEVTGVPIGTVMSRLARARNLLLAALKGRLE
jgi:RNA polymerase sigma factor (sigma-70 family)